MLYYKIKLFDGPSWQDDPNAVDGYMEVTPERVFNRLTDIDGNTLTAPTCPESYTTIENDICSPPAWISDAEKISQKEALELQYKSALRSGAVKDTDPVAWAAEVALE